MRGKRTQGFFDDAERSFNEKYFTERNEYNEADLERRFRMPRILFERLMDGVGDQGISQVHTECTGMREMSFTKRAIAVLIVVAYANGSDETDELVNMS